MKFSIDRYIFNAEHGEGAVRNCIGDFKIDDEWFCYSLEDELRADNVKIDGKTCIPEGEYFVTLTMSTRFKKLLPLVWNKNDKGNRYVESHGKRFDGIRLHGGNTELDSLGCPLLEFNTDGKKVWGKDPDASTELIKKMEEGIDYPLIIRNRIFNYVGHFKTMQ